MDASGLTIGKLYIIDELYGITHPTNVSLAFFSKKADHHFFHDNYAQKNLEVNEIFVPVYIEKVHPIMKSFLNSSKPDQWQGDWYHVYAYKANFSGWLLFHPGCSVRKML